MVEEVAAVCARLVFTSCRQNQPPSDVARVVGGRSCADVKFSEAKAALQELVMSLDKTGALTGVVWTEAPLSRKTVEQIDSDNV